MSRILTSCAPTAGLVCLLALALPAAAGAYATGGTTAPTRAQIDALARAAGTAPPVFPVAGKYDFGHERERLRRRPRPPGPGSPRRVRHAGRRREGRQGHRREVARRRRQLRRRRGAERDEPRLHAPAQPRARHPATASRSATGSAWSGRPVARPRATCTSSCGPRPAGTRAASPSTLSRCCAGSRQTVDRGRRCSAVAFSWGRRTRAFFHPERSEPCSLSRPRSAPDRRRGHRRGPSVTSSFAAW